MRRVLAAAMTLVLAAAWLPGFGVRAAAIPELNVKFDGELTNSGADGGAVTMIGAANYVADPLSSAAAIRLGYADYVQLDAAEDPIDYTGSFSVAFWMKLTDRAGGDPVLMGNKNWDSGGNPGWCLNSTATIRVNYKSSEGNRGDLNIVDTVQTADWTHIAVTFNTETNEVKTYANGVCTGADATKSLAGNLNGAGPTLLGQAYANGGGLYNKDGIYTEFLLRDFIMKQGVLSEAEVANIHGALAPQAPFLPTDVTVYPSEVNLNKGDRMRFVAEVNGAGDPTPEDKKVEWHVTGASSADTRISADGNLAIGADETAASLVVTAKSLADGTCAGNAAVTVTTPRGDGRIAFGVLSDIHVGSTDDLTVGNNARAYKAFSFLGDPALQAERVVVNGDLTGVGSWREFSVFRDLRNAALRIPLLASMGNHDENQWEYFEKATGSLANDAQVINGYSFITVSPGSGAVDEATGRATGKGTGSYEYAANWLAQQLAVAEAADPVKPIFVFIHHPMEGTHYLSNEQGATGLTDALRGHSRVIAFSGHTHGVNNHPLNIWQDSGFTTVNTAATCGGELEKAVKAVSGNIPFGIGESSQGLYVTADAQGNVSVRTRDFLNDRWLDEWRFNVGEALPYTAAGRTAQAQAPSFPDGAEIRMTSVNMTSAGFEFDQANVAENTVGDMVYYYHYELVNKASDETVKEYNDWSGWFFPNPPAVLTQDVLGLDKSTEYELRIRAVDAYGKMSSDFLSKTFTTTAISNTLHRPIDYVLTFDDSLSNGGTAPADVRMFRLVEKQEIFDTTPHYGDGKHGRAIYLTPRNFVDLDGGNEPIDYDQSFSLAFWLNVDYVRDDGEPCVLSNRNEDNSEQKGFTFRKDRKDNQNWLILEYNPTSGAYQKLWLTPIELHEWIHVAATFDYANDRVIAYVNGVKTEEAEANLAGGIGGVTGAGKNKSTFLGSSPWNYTEEHGGYNGSGSDNGVVGTDGLPEGRQTIKFWADDFIMSSCVYSPAEIQMLMADTTSRPEHYTVVFDTDGGFPEPVAQTVYKDRCASVPAEPAKEAHTFGGWYDGAAKFDFATPIAADVVLKAKWIDETGETDPDIPDEYDGISAITGSESVALGENVEYSFSVDGDDNGFSVLDIEFKYDSTRLKFESANSAAGFETEIKDGKNKQDEEEAGALTILLLKNDRTGTGISAQDLTEVLNLNFTAIAAGTASVEVVSVGAGGYNAENPNGAKFTLVLPAAPAQTVISVYHIYDLNTDGEADYADIAFMQLHYGKTGTSDDWDDIRHMDIAGADSVIDLVDIMQILRHVRAHIA
ncbi:MAG: metallophosphoesterase [Clostridiales Family XIII bacterium]|nr:metallophosphoesterase [Clostridiales Family XIII bacterium]